MDGEGRRLGRTDNKKRVRATTYIRDLRDTHWGVGQNQNRGVKRESIKDIRENDPDRSPLEAGSQNQRRAEEKAIIQPDC